MSPRVSAVNGDRENNLKIAYEGKHLEEPRNVPKWTGKRHFVTLMLFLGMANAYVMRTNMSVAIVAMVNHTALTVNPRPNGAESHVHLLQKVDNTSDQIDGVLNLTTPPEQTEDGEFVWETSTQSILLSAFFYGYVVTQIPFGILAKKYGAKYFLGVGMLVNSVFGLLVPVSAHWGLGPLIFVRFIQGLGEGPIVPCTHAMLAKWIPPNERSRLGAFVYAGAQFGTVISLPLSGLLAQYGFAGGWPSIFYVFGAVGTIWSLAFLLWVYEDPERDRGIRDSERKFIVGSLGGETAQQPPIPWMSVFKSLPFWAILIAHMGQNYGYETLLTELPLYMKQILHFSIKNNGTLSALPYLAMWIFSIVVSIVADWMTWKKGISLTVTRKILNTIGMFGPALALVAASYTGDSAPVTVGLLSLGVGLMGGTMSGYRINHLDIAPRFAGILMSLTNCIANVFALLAPLIAGYIVEGQPTQEAWRVVFFVSAAVYVVTATFYLIFGSGERQHWDEPIRDEYEIVATSDREMKQPTQETALNRV